MCCCYGQCPHYGQYPCCVVGTEWNKNPGMVPDGAKCGDNKYCINTQCVDLPPLPEGCQCSGNGVCDQYNTCHCNTGSGSRCESKSIGDMDENAGKPDEPTQWGVTIGNVV